ncbi:MAG: hypothetical protein ACC726_09560 [Chloroflexota bacterium]
MDQKRMLVVLVVIAGVIAIAAIGVGYVAVTIGLPFWLALILAVTLAAGIGLFMFLNLI